VYVLATRRYTGRAHEKTVLRRRELREKCKKSAEPHVPFFAKGNVLDLAAALEQCSVRDVALKIQNWFSIAPPKPGQPTLPATLEPEAKLAAEKTEIVAPPENKPLPFQLRGIDHTHAYLKTRGITEDTAREFGAGFFAGKGSISGRVVIPIHNERGELVAYAGRSIDDSEPRYKLPPDFRFTIA
jgi:hypothetical protein